jgi:hypothetical protein
MVEQGQKLSRVPLHSVTTPSSDVNLGRTAYGESLIFMGEVTEGN